MRRAIVARGARHVERVHLRPRRVMIGDVERVEIVPVALDLRPLGHGKPHIGEDRGHLFRHLRHGVDRAARPVARRQRHIEPFRGQPRIESGVFQRHLLCRQRRIDLVLQRVQFRPGDLPFLGRHAPKLTHLEADFALLSHGLQPQRLERRFIRGIGNGGQVFFAQIVHRDTLLKVEAYLARAGPLRKRRGMAQLRVENPPAAS